MSISLQGRQLQNMLVEILCAQDLHQNGRKALVASWPHQVPQIKKIQNRQALLEQGNFWFLLRNNCFRCSLERFCPQSGR